MRQYRRHPVRGELALATGLGSIRSQTPAKPRCAGGSLGAAGRQPQPVWEVPGPFDPDVPGGRWW